MTVWGTDILRTNGIDRPYRHSLRQQNQLCSISVTVSLNQLKYIQEKSWNQFLEWVALSIELFLEYFNKMSGEFCKLFIPALVFFWGSAFLNVGNDNWSLDFAWEWEGGRIRIYDLHILIVIIWPCNDYFRCSEVNCARNHLSISVRVSITTSDKNTVFFHLLIQGQVQLWYCTPAKQFIPILIEISNVHYMLENSYAILCANKCIGGSMKHCYFIKNQYWSIQMLLLCVWARQILYSWTVQ